MSILLTGGAGYIGSHTAVKLLDLGYEVVIVDNFYNSTPMVYERIRKITGKDFTTYEVDVCDKDALQTIFAQNNIEGVIHFAGYKAVGESVAKPLEYYRNNVDSTFALCEVMRAFGVSTFVFSSSATVYGLAEKMPIAETDPLYCLNPYGWTKYMNERILTDVANANPDFTAILLRYFNPIGAHPSGLIGEDPNGIPNNLMPRLLHVVTGKMEQLTVYGADYDTPDGTGVRDYLHVEDLAVGHVKAIEFAKTHKGAYPINLGTGTGYSVLDMIRTFEEVNGIPVAHSIVGRRPGDAATSYADPSLAYALLGWKAEKTLADMCRDAWNWCKNNPNGYK